jgi:lipid-binding SYLF domain-containing protein
MDMNKFTSLATAVIAALSVASIGAQSRSSDEAREDRQEVAAAEMADRRQEILDMSRATIAELRDDEAARRLVDEAYGHAVFDTTKGGFIVTGAGGTGVAMRSSGREPVYMHMGAGGVGLGAGIENYKLVLLFQNEETYRQFVDGAWTAGTSAQAAAGRDGVAAVTGFVNGVAVYHLTDEGLIAQADLTGVRFWPSDRLNPGPA